jgi:hypothetical protein
MEKYTTPGEYARLSFQKSVPCSSFTNLSIYCSVTAAKSFSALSRTSSLLSLLILLLHEEYNVYNSVESQNQEFGVCPKVNLN